MVHRPLHTTPFLVADRDGAGRSWCTPLRWVRGASDVPIVPVHFDERRFPLVEIAFDPPIVDDDRHKNAIAVRELAACADSVAPILSLADASPATRLRAMALAPLFDALLDEAASTW